MAGRTSNVGCIVPAANMDNNNIEAIGRCLSEPWSCIGGLGPRAGGEQGRGWAELRANCARPWSVTMEAQLDWHSDDQGEDLKGKGTNGLSV